MTRRLVLALVAVALCVSSVVVAQQAPRFRVRWAARPGGEAPAAPTIIVTSPTLFPTITVNTAALTLQGIAQSGDAPIASNGVTWTCETCSPTSGTAVYNPTTGDWLTVGGSGALTVAHDTFSGGSSTALRLLSADTVGGAWAELVNTVTPVPAISGTDYDVSVLIRGRSTGNDDGTGLVFGVQDASNYCSVLLYGSGAATDLYLLKTVGGVVQAPLDTANVDPAVGDTFKLEVRGTALKVYQSGVERMSASDSFCDDAVGVGVFMGAIRGVTTDDAVTTWQLDNFIVADQSASSGAITLDVGANPIDVTVTDANALTGTTQITVTYAAEDSIAPAVSFDIPTAGTSTPTSADSVAIGGTATDATSVSSCAFACATCTPASGALTLSSPINGVYRWSGTVEGLSEGANEVEVACLDPDANEGADTLTINRTLNDTTDPTVTAPADFTVTSSPATVGPVTATDDVAVTRLRWVCDVCPAGTASITPGPSVTGSPSVVLAEGPNVLTFIGEDGAGNEGTDSVTVTFTNTLQITTTTMPSATQNAAYGPSGTGVQLLRVGGTSPFAWDNNSGGTSLGGGACTGGSISAAGVVSGTFTTVGTCNFTVKITDSAGSPASDTQALSIIVRDPAASGPHSYYVDLINRPDCYRTASMRPNAAQTTAMSNVAGVADCTAPHYDSQLLRAGYASLGALDPIEITYCFTGAEPGCAGADTDPNKQDAAKSSIPAWRELVASATVSYVLGADLNPSDTTLTITPCTFSVTNNKVFRVGAEIIRSTSAAGKVCTFPIARGEFGTAAQTAVVKPAGTQMYANQTAAGHQIRVPTRTDGSVTATYLYTWDAMFTSTYLRLAGHEFKAFNTTNWSSTDQILETQTRKPIAGVVAPTFDSTQHVWVIGARLYGSFAPPTTKRDPLLPMASNAFIIFPNKWVRFWLLIEANAEPGDGSKFETLTTLAAPVLSTDDTENTITINYPSSIAGVPLSYDEGIFESPTGAYPGRVIRIGSELMTVVASGTTTGTRVITVSRGAYGSTKATHLAGANVEIINDKFTLYAADEDNEPVLLIDRQNGYLRMDHATLAGSLSGWWWQFSTSGGDVAPGRALGVDGIAGTADDFAPLVAYVRNFVMLKNAATAGDHSSWADLRVKPVR